MNELSDNSDAVDQSTQSLMSDDLLGQLLQYHATVSDEEFVNTTVAKIMYQERKRQLILVCFGLFGVLSFCFLIDALSLSHAIASFGNVLKTNLPLIMTGITLTLGAWIIGNEADLI
jgi:hypothetical protein